MYYLVRATQRLVSVELCAGVGLFVVSKLRTCIKNECCCWFFVIVVVLLVVTVGLVLCATYRATVQKAVIASLFCHMKIC